MSVKYKRDRAFLMTWLSSAFKKNLQGAARQPHMCQTIRQPAQYTGYQCCTPLCRRLRLARPRSHTRMRSSHD